MSLLVTKAPYAGLVVEQLKNRLTKCFKLSFESYRSFIE